MVIMPIEDRFLIVELIVGIFNEEEVQVGAFSDGHCETLRMFVVSSSETARGSAGAGGWCVGGCWLTPVAEGGEAAVRPLASVPSPVSSSPGRHRHHHLSTAQCPPGLQPDNTPQKIFLSPKNILCDSYKSSLQPPEFIPWLHLA